MPLSANIIRELRTYFLSLDRKNVMSDDLKPDVDDTLRLGSPTKKFHAIYASRIIADDYEGVIGGGGGGEIDHADTVGVDYLTATEAAIDGNLYPLGTGAVFPSTVLPADVAYQNTTPTFTSINVTNYVDGVAVGAHEHSGSANMGVQVSHADLLNLSADHHTIYTRWDDTETVIKKWKFSNLAEENQSFNEYVGWEVEATVAMEDDGGWVPIMGTAQAVLQSLSFTDPTYGHSYPLRIISHAQYSSIQLGASAEILIKTDYDPVAETGDTWIDVGNITLSNNDGITVGSTFEVTQAGVLTATSGYIGTWQILDDKLQSTSGDAVLDSDGYIILKGSSIETRISSIHADYRLWVGGSGESTWDATTAKFIVNTAGQVTAETVAIKGLIHNYGSDKWKITSDGHAEFESIKCRGRLDTLVFTKSTVSTISGVLSLTNAGVLSEDVTDSQTYLYLDAPEFGFGDIILLQPSADNMEWMLIISTYTQMVIQNADGEDVTVYKYTVSRDFGDYGTSYSFEKGVAVNGRGSYSVGNDPLPLASGNVQGVFGDYQPSGTATGAGGGWLSLDGESTHLTVNVRTGPLPEQYQQYIRIGNLQGILDYTDVEWGLFVGDENEYLSYEETTGLIYYSRDGATIIDEDGITTDAMTMTGLLKIWMSGGIGQDFLHLRDTTDTADLYFRYSSTGWQFRTEAGGTGNLLMHFTDDGKVGVGVKPIYPFQVNSGGSNAVARFESTDANAFIYLKDDTTTDGHVRVGAHGNALELWAGDADILHITSSTMTSVADLRMENTFPNIILNETDSTDVDDYWRVMMSSDDFHIQFWDDSDAEYDSLIQITDSGAFFYTGWVIEVENASPAFYLKETDAADPNDTWRLVGTGSNFGIYHRDDSASLSNLRMHLNTAGWISFYQLTDSQGIRVYGADDMSAEWAALTVSSAGYGTIQSSDRLSIVSGEVISNSATSDIYLKVGDAVGAKEIRFYDSGWAVVGKINSNGQLYLREQSAAGGDVAYLGQIWVKNDDPNVLMYTNGDGTDFTVDITAV